MKLEPDGTAEVLVLTTPSSATRARLRGFCRRVLESPDFPRWEDGQP